MAKIIAFMLAASMIAGATQVMAAEENVRICALTKGLECIPEEGCKEFTIPEMPLPRFVRIDLNAKTITSLDKEIRRTTQIAAIDRLADKIILHGTEQRGWSMALGKESGALTLSASGDGEGFIVFGSCISP